MADYKLYLICGGIVALSLLINFLVVISYGKKKKELKDEQQQTRRQLQAEEQQVRRQLQVEEQQSRQKLQTEEQQTRLKLQEEERQSQERIRLANNDLLRQQEEFNRRVEVFDKEQRLREDMNNKTDRDIAIEMHVKAMHIFEMLSNMDSKLSGVQDYSNQFNALSSNVTRSVEDLTHSLATSVVIIKSDLEDSIKGIDSTVREAVADSSNTLDSEDVKHALSDALYYDSYSFKSYLEESMCDAVKRGFASTDIKGEVADAITEASNPWNYGSNSFKSNLEEIMRDTIINYVDSKFSDLDWKLSSIESKLNCM